MITFRNIDASEFRILRNHFDYFGKQILDRISKNKHFVVGHGKRKEIFLISKCLYEIYTKLKKFRSPYYLGLFLGTIVKNKFIYSLNSLQILNKYSNKKIITNYRGEIQFIYGNDLYSKHILKIPINFKKYDKILVVNSRNELLGLGMTLYPILKSISQDDTMTKKNDKITKQNIKIKNLIDIGWYLRKGK
ncbi:MAG: NIP7 pre-PUA domain-containing protein [Candidatus Helarchaeota archaeon]